VRRVSQQKQMLAPTLIQAVPGEVAQAAKSLVHCIAGAFFNLSHSEFLSCWNQLSSLEACTHTGQLTLRAHAKTAARGCIDTGKP
jgi:hypothetical protein